MIRGPLGIGKTTVAQRLAASLRGAWISVDAILEEHDLEQWEDGYISEQSFLRSNAFVVGRAAGWLAKGPPVVVDGNFYWKSQVEDLVRRLPVPTFVFTLQAPLAVCLERDAHRERPFGEQSTRDVYRKVTSFECGIPVDATRPLRTIVADLSAQLRANATTSRAVRARRSRG
ncbi:MAG: ATP-binding protein [Thermoplasmata archaeon]|nr:ATP-binding protein [Thermoplasmata archaeon]